MADTVDADPEALTQLASRTLTTVDGFSDALTQMTTAVQLTATDLGSTPAGAVVHRAATFASEAAEGTVGALTEVYERDADNLFQTAVAYRETDLDQAARSRSRMRPV